MAAWRALMIAMFFFGSGGWGVIGAKINAALAKSREALTDWAATTGSARTGLARGGEKAGKGTGSKA